MLGNEGYRRDVKGLGYNIFDNGRFSLKEEGQLILKKVCDFLD